MFQLLRYFTIASAVAIILVTGVLTYIFRNYAENELVSLVQDRNVSLAQTFANSIWPVFSEYIDSNPALADGLRDRPEIGRIHEILKTLAVDLPVLKVKIFSPAGLTLYSSDASEIGSIKSDIPGLAQAARGGEPSSRISRQESFVTFDSTVAVRDLVETYLPIRTDGGIVVGVFQLYTDVTPLMARIRNSTQQVLITLLTMLGVFYLVLFLIVRHADKTLKTQYARLQQDNENRRKVEEDLREAHDLMEYQVMERTAALRKEMADRKQAQTQLIHSQKMDALGKLTGGVAHEFNNLLLSIGGYSRLISDEPEDTELVEECVREVIKASDQAAKLTSQMLAFARKRPMEPKTVRVSRIIRDLRPMLGPLLGENVGLSLDITDEEACVTVDPGQLSQAIMNLAINGCQAMKAGGQLIIGNSVVTLDEKAVSKSENAEPGVYTAVIVIDTGTGMEKETIEHIFEPFFTTKEEGEGTGLGLAMVYGLADQSGGFIDVMSEFGSGTVFTIYLPIAEGKEAEAEPAGRTDRFIGHGTVLVAEDEKSVRNLVRKTLEKLGYSVLTARDGATAVEVFGTYSSEIDFLLTDIAMPGMNGYELARKLLSAKPDLKVVFMSGNENDRPRFHGPVSDGIGSKSCFLSKPFDPEILGQVMGELLDA